MELATALEEWERCWPDGSGAASTASTADGAVELAGPTGVAFNGDDEPVWLSADERRVLAAVDRNSPVLSPSERELLAEFDRAFPDEGVGE